MGGGNKGQCGIDAVTEVFYKRLRDFFVIYYCSMFAFLVCFTNICNVSFLRSINSYVDLGG